MTDRDALIAGVLSRTIWHDWAWHPVSGDASARRYLRLRKGDQSVIVMDAPPDTCPETPRFVEIANLLGTAGLCAPEVLLQDLPNGILVLSDLGATDLAAHLRQHPTHEEATYRTAADVVIAVGQITPPTGLTRLTPRIGAQMLDVLGTHYCRSDISPLQHAMQNALATFAPVADSLSLRDFHAENLIWRGDLIGHDRLGLLDFQDAFIAPAGYDLASLLRDARRDVSPRTVAQTTAHFLARTGAAEGMADQIAVLGVQRNLRILGVFARLAGSGGKTRYLDYLDRVWRHIQADLARPALAELAVTLRDLVPPPTPDFVAGLQG